jgi:hypothetical protein
MMVVIGDVFYFCKNVVSARPFFSFHQPALALIFKCQQIVRI